MKSVFNLFLRILDWNQYYFLVLVNITSWSMTAVALSQSLAWLQQLMFSFDSWVARLFLFKAALLNNSLFPKSYQELGRVLYCFQQERKRVGVQCLALGQKTAQDVDAWHMAEQALSWLQLTTSCANVTLNSAKWHWEGRESPGCRLLLCLHVQAAHVHW